MEQPQLVFVFELSVEISTDKPHEMKTPKGLRRIIPITGGSFEGPGIKGAILPGGNDWQLIRPDGVIEIDARYLLKTAEDVFITITNPGLRHGPPDVIKRLGAGEPVDPHEYYFRCAPVFETGDSRYDWLTKNTFIATGIRKPDRVLIQVWKVL